MNRYASQGLSAVAVMHHHASQVLDYILDRSVGPSVHPRALILSFKTKIEKSAIITRAHQFQPAALSFPYCWLPMSRRYISHWSL